jgi:Icc protein
LLRELLKPATRLSTSTKLGACRLAVAAVLAMLAPVAASAGSFHFVILGDRTGEARPGIFDEVWREAAADDLAFVIQTGDMIEGLHDATTEAEWQAVERRIEPYRRYPLYLAPGNHDIWSERSEMLFRKYTRRALHYGFDYQQAHFTILDNSRSQQLSAEELKFLETDLEAHAAQPVKFVISHRPSWLIDAILKNPNFALHQLAKKYGVRYVISGHVHQMLHADLDGVTYISMASSGGMLRASRRYEDGWFFGYALVEVSGEQVDFRIQELKPPRGEGRVTSVADWGVAGLTDRGRHTDAPANAKSTGVRRK